MPRPIPAFSASDLPPRIRLVTRPDTGRGVFSFYGFPWAASAVPSSFLGPPIRACPSPWAPRRLAPRGADARSVSHRPPPSPRRFPGSAITPRRALGNAPGPPRRPVEPAADEPPIKNFGRPKSWRGRTAPGKGQQGLATSTFPQISGTSPAETGRFPSRLRWESGGP